MTTTWTDSEYARVARALLYPLSKTATVIQGGVKLTTYLRSALDAPLQLLDEQEKQDCLVLADKIEQKMLEKFDSLQAPDVTQVGDIKRDPMLGLNAQQSVIAEMRALLSSRVNFPVNVVGAGPGASSINATWCPLWRRTPRRRRARRRA